MAEQQTPASVVERLRRKATASFEANKGFGRKGKEWAIETEVEWQAAALIERLSAEREGLEAELIEARTLDKGFYEWMIERDLLARGEEVEWGDIVVALTEHEIECSALTQGESKKLAFNPFGTGLSEPRLTSEQMAGVQFQRPSDTQGESRQTGWQDIATGDLVARHIRRSAEDAGFGLPAAPTPADGGGE
jgi:hypothetical protein